MNARGARMEGPWALLSRCNTENVRLNEENERLLEALAKIEVVVADASKRHDHSVFPIINSIVVPLLKEYEW